jgi:hypothetical protein
MTTNAMPPLKYQNDIKKIVGCPSATCVPADVVCYRLVFSDISHRKNFLPVAILEPNRQISSSSIQQCCSAYALSVFKTLPQLKGHVAKVLKSAPQFLRKVGDHYVELQVTVNDGACGEYRSSGHFSFFEATGFSPAKAVRSHQKLF